MNSLTRLIRMESRTKTPHRRFSSTGLRRQAAAAASCITTTGGGSSAKLNRWPGKAAAADAHSVSSGRHSVSSVGAFERWTILLPRARGSARCRTFDSCDCCTADHRGSAAVVIVASDAMKAHATRELIVFRGSYSAGPVSYVRNENPPHAIKRPAAKDAIA
jgi:hypothetical protein